MYPPDYLAPIDGTSTFSFPASNSQDPVLLGRLSGKVLVQVKLKVGSARQPVVSTFFLIMTVMTLTRLKACKACTTFGQQHHTAQLLWLA